MINIVNLPKTTREAIEVAVKRQINLEETGDNTTNRFYLARLLNAYSKRAQKRPETLSQLAKEFDVSPPEDRLLGFPRINIHHIWDKISDTFENQRQAHLAIQTLVDVQNNINRLREGTPKHSIERLASWNSGGFLTNRDSVKVFGNGEGKIDYIRQIAKKQIVCWQETGMDEARERMIRQQWGKEIDMICANRAPGSQLGVCTAAGGSDGAQARWEPTGGGGVLRGAHIWCSCGRRC